jgi:dimethylhistidine N-methyltransferase
MDVQTELGSEASLAAVPGLFGRERTLPAELLYDDRGSALFVAITRLPEYYLTRIERALLEEHADEIITRTGRPGLVVELGAGTADKTRLVIDALLRVKAEVAYCPIDVSPIALDAAARSLARPGLLVHAMVGRYQDRLPHVRRLAGPRLVLFIGSSIGNYEPATQVALLSEVRAVLSPDDRLLVGADLRKDPRVLLPAYDDAQGVTAAFNKNVLERLNRELGADFQLDQFRHVALWNERESRIEMHLESRVQQLVTFAALGRVLGLGAGERIHTESSYKLALPEQERILRAAGFRPEAAWLDDDRWYALHLAAAQ